MKLYLKRNQANINAIANYNVTQGTFTVLKGSIVSKTISYSEKFKGAYAVKKARDGIVVGDKVIKNISFKSASTAANFVTGTSTNGLLVWKAANGKNLKQILSENEATTDN